jgi:hypothetical protein
MDILDKINNILNELSYKPRKVMHGKKKSMASRQVGPERIEYIKSLKRKRRQYKMNPILKTITKRKSKLYRKTAKHKMNVKIYKLLNKKA